MSGKCSYQCHYNFINVLKVSANRNALWAFWIFSQNNCLMNIITSYSFHTLDRQTHLGPCVLVLCIALLYLNFWFAWNMPATTILQLTLGALYWRNNTVARWFPTAMPRKLLFVWRRDIVNCICSSGIIV